MPEKDKARTDYSAGNSSSSEFLTSGSAVMSVGFILTMISLLADIIGYGTFDEFGILQTLGTIVGVVLILLGFIIKIFAKIFYG